MPLTSTQVPCLWIVATPLGNPGDLSPRAAQVLSEADLILAEDTRRSGQLFAKCGLTAKRFISYHEHNEDENADYVLAELKAGKTIALISDAGMPLLSDPGFKLVRAARDSGIKVSVVPGPSAILTALAASGIAPQPFIFLGFLPRKRSEQEKLFAKYSAPGLTLVFFERKDRVPQSLALAYEILGKREVCIARELTKIHEEFIFGILGDANFLPENLLGEITIVIGPLLAGLEDIRTDEKHILALASRINSSSSGLKPKELARRIADMAEGWTAKEIYQFLQCSSYQDKD